VQEPAGAGEVVLDTVLTVELENVLAELLDDVVDRVALEVDTPVDIAELLELVLEGPVLLLLL
jgi:hypothetical protein